MTSHISTIDRLRGELARLYKDEADLISKEAAALGKFNRAREGLDRTKSTSTVSSKLKEMERAQHDQADAAKKRAAVTKKIADKSKDLNNYLERQAKEDERSRKKIADEQNKLLKEREGRAKALTDVMRRAASLPAASVTVATSMRLPDPVDPTFDFFLSHASEDKDDFVRPLVEALKAKGAKVFFDEQTMKIGDSLRRSIDAGIRNSRFGVVVLSASFFHKEWPAKELGGLTALEVAGNSRILPIWHKVTKDEVSNYSPTLADKVALNSSIQTIDEIASDLVGLL